MLSIKWTRAMTGAQTVANTKRIIHGLSSILRIIFSKFLDIISKLDAVAPIVYAAAMTAPSTAVNAAYTAGPSKFQMITQHGRLFTR